MCAMIFSSRIAGLVCGRGSREPAAKQMESASSPVQPLLHGGGINSDERRVNKREASRRGRGISAVQQALGFLLAILSGVFGAVQYAVVTEGKAYEENKHGCAGNTTLCPADMVESFDKFGSWFVSFGIGALLSALAALGVASVLPGCETRRLTTGPLERCPPGDGGNRAGGIADPSDAARDKGQEGAEGAPTGCVPPGAPKLEWRVLRVAGVAAGLFWALGNFCVSGPRTRPQGQRCSAPSAIAPRIALCDCLASWTRP